MVRFSFLQILILVSVKGDKNKVVPEKDWMDFQL